MAKNYAVIDIGTLKVKLLIASVSSQGVIINKYSSNTLTCFGVDIDKNRGKVQQKYLNRTVAELKRCKKVLDTMNVFKAKIVSTHAMRKAKNKDQILKTIKGKTEFDVEIISQEEEAKLFFNAVMKDFTKSMREYAVLDMGGGSVQVLIGNKDKLQKAHLMQTGAQYLHDNFTKNPHFPGSVTTQKDIEKMKDYILKQLLPLEKMKDVPIIYGSSNIIDLMKAIRIPLIPHEDSKTHPYKTYSKYLREFIKKVLPMSYEQREKTFEFQKGYMWGIDKAFLNVVTISRHFNSPHVIPSNANIARGIIYSMIE